MADELLGVLLPKEVKRQLKEVAARKGFKPSPYARSILMEHLESLTAGKPPKKKGTAK